MSLSCWSGLRTPAWPRVWRHGLKPPLFIRPVFVGIRLNRGSWIQYCYEVSRLAASVIKHVLPTSISVMTIVWRSPIRPSEYYRGYNTGLLAQASRSDDTVAELSIENTCGLDLPSDLALIQAWYSVRILPHQVPRYPTGLS